jgi:hypothetical protein
MSNVEGEIGTNVPDGLFPINDKLTNKIKLTTIQHAILRHVWSLPKDAALFLNRYILLRAPVKQLLDHINTEHVYEDFLSHQYNSFIITYIQCNASHLEDIAKITPDRTVLISLRVRYDANLWCAIIWLCKEEYLHTKIIQNSPWLE